ncbi:MAG TPA: tetratricopeptide repeat protein [Burkholderiaceae bacterium]
MQFARPLFALAIATLCMHSHAHEYSALIKAKKFGEAERAVNAKLAAEPRNAVALSTKIELITGLGQQARYEEAVSLGEQCVAAHPQLSSCHEAHGDAVATKALSSGMFAAMRHAGTIKDAYLKAVELDPKNFSARRNLLQYYVQAPAVAGGGKDRAQALVTETGKVNAEAGKLLQALLNGMGDGYATGEAPALAAQPGDNEELQKLQRDAFSLLGSRYLNDKKFADADRMYRELQKRYPENSGAFLGLGRVQMEQGKHAEAVALFEKGVAMDATAGLHYRMGQALQALRDKARATASFEKALTMQPPLNSKAKADVQEQLKALRG